MKSQKDRILSYLKNGRTLTALQALERFDCLRLAARVDDLRSMGHDITTEWVKRDGKRFAKYRLVA